MLDANQPWSEISVHGCFGVEIMLSSAHMQEISKHFGENKMMEDALHRYYQRFGEKYPLIVSDTKSDEEIIARMEARSIDFQIAIMGVCKISCDNNDFLLLR